jgi:hypothetical protein
MERLTTKTIKIPLHTARTCDLRQHQHLPTSIRRSLFSSTEPYRQFLPEEHECVLPRPLKLPSPLHNLFYK